MTTSIDRSSTRVKQVEGMFDVPPSEQQTIKHEVSMPLAEKAWQIGLIVGPSGSGKTTVARHYLGESMVDEYPWPKGKAVVDGFPERLGIKAITEALSSVGFSSPPAWLRPYSVLSNGEKFRANLARSLVDEQPMVVIDEFTSVVDRRVAKIGCHAVQKAIRRKDRKLVAVACHYDIIDWLQPDWVLDMASSEFTWRSVQPRPPIELDIRRVPWTMWKTFKVHHYLSDGINKSAQCFCAFVDGAPAAFLAVISFAHPKSPGWRIHRTVTLPDFQGVGIGKVLTSRIAAAYAASKRVSITTGHPAFIHSLNRSPDWHMIRKPSHVAAPGSKAVMNAKMSVRRVTASFVWCGEKDVELGLELGIKGVKR